MQIQFSMILVLALTGLASEFTVADDLRREAALRAPVALAAGETIYVANRRSGSVSIIDRSEHRVVRETRVGDRLSDLLAKRGLLLATDESAHELILLECGDNDVHVVQRLRVASYPVSVEATSDGTLISVASLWSRRVTLVEFREDRDANERLQSLATIDLPFGPREQWIAPDDKHLVVADSFGGRLAVIDLQCRSLIALRSIETHNIRGLAISADGRELLIAHQLLNSNVPTHSDRIFWGAVVSNVLRSVALNELLAPVGADVVRPIGHWSLIPLGEPRAGAGDPADVLVSQQGATLVALTGVDEVAVRRRPHDSLVHLKTGRRPTALAIDATGNYGYVANTLDDTISVVDLHAMKVTAAIELGPRPPLTSADRGESLFYDGRLSLDNWYSCHSCHTDGHTNGLLNDNFSDGSERTPKRILSLLGVGDTGPWAWNGKQTELHSQIHASILSTMGGRKEAATEANSRDLVAYLETLSPPPSIAAARGVLDEAAIQRGRRVFESRACGDCHQPPRYTSAESYDVGLQDEAGQREFNPPSLRGVSQRDGFFHDNRATTLRDVFDRIQHPGGDRPNERELQDLLSFLESL